MSGDRMNVGEQDFIQPAIAGEIAQALPDATLVAIPNCGHFACSNAGLRCEAR
jgi:pimeloyl-ACP methyl ester carboxylesterase